MATHSNILAWEILWTEESGGLQSMGSQRVGHDSATKQQQQLTILLSSILLEQKKKILNVLISTLIILLILNMFINS